MKESLQNKIDLLGKNSLTVLDSAKFDYAHAANLAALLFTAENLVANEDDIRANKALLKEHEGKFSALRGSGMRLALIARMCIKPDAEAYLDKVAQAYDAIVKFCKLPSESLVLTAMAMVEDTNPADFESAARSAWEILDKMKKLHPLITNQNDLTLCHLINKSGFESEAMLDTAEVIFKKLKPTGFKLNKDALQSISIILALGDKSVDEKCAKFTEIRKKLDQSNHGVAGDELAILAAFANTDIPIDEAVAEIAEVDDKLKHVPGYGTVASGSNLRRLYASALVLQVYGEEMRTVDAAANNAIATRVTETVVYTVIMMVVAMIIVTCSMGAITASH